MWITLLKLLEADAALLLLFLCIIQHCVSDRVHKYLGNNTRQSVLLGSDTAQRTSGVPLPPEVHYIRMTALSGVCHSAYTTAIWQQLQLHLTRWFLV